MELFSLSCHSIFDGTVVSIDEIDDSNVGITVVIKSSYKEQDIYLKYCHLNQLSKLAKDAFRTKKLIKRGDIIGKTGNTGNAKNIAVNRYHVHIEASTDGVFYGGKSRVDPESFMTTKFDVNGEAVID